MSTVIHKSRCAFLRAEPCDGDEAALCSCGAVEEAFPRSPPKPLSKETLAEADRIYREIRKGQKP